MPTTFPPTRVIESPGSPNNTFWSEDFGAYVDAYSAGTWPLNIGVDLDPMIWMLTPQDTPLTGTNTPEGGLVMPSSSCDETEVYWGTEDIITPYSQLKAAVTTNSQTNLEVDDSARFRVGDMIKVGAIEVMLVSAIVDADTLTVVRGQLGTTAQTSILIDSNVYAIGRVAPEGSDPIEMDARDVDLFSNFCQIIGPWSIRFTKTSQAIRRVMVQDEVAHQVAQRLKELNLRREFNFYHGIKYKSGRSRSMGGVRHFIAGAGFVDSSSTALNVAAVTSRLGLMWGRGGMDGSLVLQANPAAMAGLNAENAGQVQVVYTESRRGLTPTQFVDTEYGSVQCVRNRWYPASEATIYAAGQPRRRVLRPIQISPLPASGDFSAWMMVGEETLQFNAPQISAIFTALNYTSTVPTTG